MVRVAAEALADSSEGKAGALAVTVLTSLDEHGLNAVGVDRPLGDHVAAMAQIGAKAGAEGVVCAVTEAARVKELGLDLIVVTPGIRPAGAESTSGADLLVVGRPITSAPDPVAAAIAIVDEIASALSTA
jgi:orotidine-5'-phosphate decarboxylase